MKATKVAAKEYHINLFLHMADSRKYRKTIKVTKNAVLREKDAFPLKVTDVCRLLTALAK